MSLLFHFAVNPLFVLAYLVALQVGALQLLSVLSIASNSFLPADRRSRECWRWFGIAMLGQSAAVLAMAVVGGLNRTLGNDAFRAIYLLFAAPASVALLEFAFRAGGRSGWSEWRRVFIGAFVVAWLVPGVVSTPAILPHLFPWMLALPAYAAGTWALAAHARSRSLRANPRQHWALGFCSAGLAGLGLLQLAGPAHTDRYQGWTFNTYSLYPVHEVSPGAAVDGRLLPYMYSHDLGHVLFIAGGALLAWVVFISWWVWVHSVASESGKAGLGWRRLLWILPINLTLMVAAGFSLLFVMNAHAVNKLRDQYVDRLRTCEVFLGAGLVRAALNGPAAERTAELDRLTAALDTIHVYNPDFHRIYVWRLRKGMIDVVAAPRGLPVGPYRPFSEADPTVLARGLPVADQPSVKIGGRVFRPFHLPLLGRDSGAPVAWLGAELPTEDWLAEKQEMMTVSVVSILLLFGVGVLLLIYHLKHSAAVALRIESQRAEQAERIKTELLATLSHDVRTPLQSILAYAGLLDATLLDARQRGQLAALREQAQALLHMLQNLLHLSTVQLGFVPRRERFAIRRLAETQVAGIRPLAAAKRLAVEASLAGDLPEHVIGDELRLRQILLNLLTNAVKFTERGRVTLEVAVDPADPVDPANRWFAFTVRDTGPGIPPDLQSGLFDLRPGRVGVRDNDGVGLGLVLVGKLSLMLGGAAQVRSQPGCGAEFTVRLPFAVSSDEATGAEPTRILSARPDRRLHRVLLVEDHRVVRAAIAETLTGLGYEVETAADAAEGIGKWRGSRFDGALIDLGLPDRSGLVLAAHFREGDSAGAWLVALTAAHGEEVHRTVAESGFDRYVPKPADARQLWEALTPADTVASHPPPARTAIGAAAIETLHEEAQTARAAIEKALGARDAPSASHYTHHLRNTALMLNDRELASAASALESALRVENPNWTTVAREFDLLRESAVFR